MNLQGIMRKSANIEVPNHIEDYMNLQGRLIKSAILSSSSTNDDNL